MQAMPDIRQQSFDEIYGPPENFLEIEVRQAHSPFNDTIPYSVAFPLTRTNFVIRSETRAPMAWAVRCTPITR